VPNFGLDENARPDSPSLAGNHVGTPSATPRAPAKLLPDEDIGIKPAKAPDQQAQAQHGGPRLPDMLNGIGEARPGGTIPDAAGGEAAAGGAAAAGAGEAAAGSSAIAELAPLALAAL
jgi:hypothetical protein